MGRLATLGCLLAVVLLLSGAGTAAIAEPQKIGLQQEFDRVQFRVTVHANGSATWTVHYERTLGNESEKQQFESFAERFNENETSLYRGFVNRSRALTRHGREVTGRSMNATGFDRRAASV